MKFRTGASGRTLRVQINDQPDEEMDLLIGIVDSSDQAEIIVNAVNAVERIRELHKQDKDSSDYSERVEWPCPTIEALEDQ